MTAVEPLGVELRDVSWGIGGRAIVHGVDAVIESGEVVGLVGANGSGKSSLLRCVVGLRTPTGGAVRVDGTDVHAMPATRRARAIAFVDQVTDVADDLRVHEVVALGRSPYLDRWRGLTTRDSQVVAESMERVDIGHLAHRGWRELSGGERQRAHLARALAQQTPVIVLDEPTNHLDVRHQLELMGHLRGCGATVVASLHDLGLVGRYCDRVLVLRDGGLVAQGPPAAVLTPDLVRQAFEVDATVTPDATGTWAISYAPASPDRPPA